MKSENVLKKNIKKIVSWLVDYGYRKHYHVKHSEHEFAKRQESYKWNREFLGFIVKLN